MMTMAVASWRDDHFLDESSFYLLVENLGVKMKERWLFG
jgi:hypothetical protein